MRAPAFWWRPPGVRSFLLAPIGAAVGRVAANRMSRPGASPPVPVVCVGNFVVGGAGKTPTAIAVARVAREAGIEPVFLTRGYGGRLRGPLVVDPEQVTAADVGDEALLLAEVAPTIVARDRPSAFPLLEGMSPGLAIMDDGFQNPSVEKSLTLVVVDGEVGVGAGRVMPAGPLRAPLSAQFPRADAIVVLGKGDGGRAMIRLAARAGKPVLRAALEPVGLDAIGGRAAFAYSGIGRPAKFYATLENAGITVAGTRSFGDHHAFTGLEAGEILTEAERLNAVPVTTAKDAVRLMHADPGPRSDLLARSVVLDVRAVFDDEARLVHLLREARDGWSRRR